MLTPIPARWPCDSDRAAPGHFALRRVRDVLHIEATLATSSNHSESSADPTFCAGLWRDDVFELFLGTRDSDEYYEFHLSPQGACWAGHFKGIRQLEAELPTAIRLTKLGSGGQILHGEVSLDQLAIPIAESPLFGNACAIIKQSPRIYGSWAEIDTEEPDYHRPESWAELPVGD